MPYAFRNKLYRIHRDVFIYHPDRGRYDPEVTYTIKPGEFVFSQVEYSNLFKINSAGLRDDEESLVKPEIIVLGDSESMGMPVAQEKTYAQLLESQLGFKVLNAGVASYGTVREMRLLNRLDVSNLKYLIIHYDQTDRDENLTFFENGNLEIMPEKRFRKLVQMRVRENQYFPGRYTLRTAMTLLRKHTRLQEKKSDPRQVIKSFIHAVMNAHQHALEKVRIVVIGSGYFIRRLNEEIQESAYPNYIESLRTVNVNAALRGKCEEDCRYILDQHLPPKAHRILADELIRLIREEREMRL